MDNIANKPLADRMRADGFEEFVGQEHLAGKGKILRLLIEQDRIPSMIFWGPPGTGKTTLAQIIANETKSHFIKKSAVIIGVKDIRSVVAEAKDRRLVKKEKTILFLDEIHRFNKSQQDALLPYVEDGTITLIGATTENPSFEVNSALISRSRVFVLKQLSPNNIMALLERAMADQKKGLNMPGIFISPEDSLFLAEMSNGDARTALNILELSASAVLSEGKKAIDREKIKEAFQRTNLLYDKGGEEHYNIISALHKSMRGNDADAALYWLARMLEAGEDPLYVARRLIRFASEDIGIANSFALPQATAAYDACHYIGMPECAVNLAQAVAYMAMSKKSNKLYMAYNDIKKDIEKTGNLPVPLHIRNAPTKLMKELGYGEGYKYTPDFDDMENAKQDYLPEELKGRKYLR